MGTSNGTGSGPGKDSSYQKIKNDSSRSCGSHSTENTELNENDESEEAFNEEIYPSNSTTRPHHPRKSTLNKSIVIGSVLTLICLAVLGILVGFSYFMCGSHFGLIVGNCETTTSTTEGTAPTNLNKFGTGGYANIEDHPNFKYFPQQLSDCGHPATSLLLRRQNENRKNISESASSNSNAGAKSRNRRLVGGNEVTDPTAFPWLVKIITSHFNGTHNVSRFVCGGTLVTKRHVLTSAHCVYAENVGGVRLNDEEGTEVKAESVTINSNYEEILDEYLELFETNAEETINQTANNLSYSESHENSNSSTEAEAGIDFDTFLRLHLNPHRSYDIALIRLDRDVSFNWTNFSPVCLPFKKYYKLNDPKDFDYAGTGTGAGTGPGRNPLYSAGWGFTNPNINNESSISKGINYLSLPFVGNSRCQDVYYTNDTNITSKMICAGAIKGQDLCQGDSGGPLFLEVKGRSFQVGVAAFGKEPCDIGAPTVFVNVSRFIKWILDSL